jgi:hypothetical protein
VLARLARQFSVAEEELRLRLRDLRRRMAPSSAVQNEPSTSPTRTVLPATPLSVWERELLEIVLLEPEAVPAAAEVIRPEQMESGLARAVFIRCCQLSHEGITPDFDRLLLEFDQQEIKNLLVDLDEQGRAKTFDEQGNIKPSAEPASRLHDLLSRIRSSQQARAIGEQAQRLDKEGTAADENTALLIQVIEQERKRRGISSPMEG